MAVPTRVGSGAGSSGVGTITPALPASLQTNDILLMVCESANEAVTVSNAAGGTWTEVTNSPQGTGTAAGVSSTRVTVFWSRYNGTQTAPTLADAGDHVAAVITAFRGCKTSGDPWNVTSGNVITSSTTALSATGATTTAAECLVVICACLMDDAQSFGGTWTNANLTSITNPTNFGHAAGNDGRIGVTIGTKATAGAYGATTNTLTAASVMGLMTIALEPASSNVIVTPGVGAPVFAGLAPLALLAIRIATGVGAPVFTGFAPTVAISDHKVVTPGLGAPVFTGQSPAIQIGSNTIIQPGTGQPVFSGLAPTILVTVNIPVGLGQPVFTGQAPTVAISNNQFPAPGLGQPVFTGFAPSVVAAVTAKPDVGQPVFTGFAPSAVLSDNQFPAPGLGQSVFSGFAPSVSVASNIVSPGLQQTVFTGFAPEVIQPLREGIAKHSLTVSMSPAHGLEVVFQYKHGESIMDTYRTSNDELRTSNDHLRTSDAPMRYR